MVKVQRPGIRLQIQSDIEIIRQIARQIENRTAWGKRYGMTSIVEEFSLTLNEELDYRNEAVNTDRLRRNMANQGGVHVPFVYWDYVSGHVLTMEAINGFKINDLASIEAAGIDRAAVADTLIRSIFQQLLLDGFYHADPHPGNLLIDPSTGKLIYIDLGMMGSLLPEQRQILGEMVNAILNQDSLEIVRLLLAIGKTIKPINETRMRREIDHLLHRYLEATLDQISFSNLLSEILSTIYKNGIQLPSEFVLALKALIQGEDVALQLDPHLAIIDIGKTISQQFLWQRLNPQALITGAASSLRESLRLARSLPRATEILIKQIEDGALQIGLDIPDFSKTVNHAYVISNRLTAAVIVVGMIVGSSIAMGVPPTGFWIIIPILGIIAFVLSMIVGMLLVLDVFIDLWRTRRRK
jgi:ubiquinone biosynthesis protein